MIFCGTFLQFYQTNYYNLFSIGKTQCVFLYKLRNLFKYNCIKLSTIYRNDNTIETIETTELIHNLHFYSTDAVIPPNLKDVDEDFKNDEVQGKLTSGYAQTKWVAEKLVLNSRMRGLPTVIFRLGI